MNNESEKHSQDMLSQTTESHDTAKSQKKSGGFLSSIFDIIEMASISIIAVLVLFSFCFRLCRVEGHSMDKTLNNGEMLITTNIFYEPGRGDIVVFHLSNEYYKQPLVKRVIALEGDVVRINFQRGTVSVNGQLLDERYVYLEGGTYRVKSDFDRQYIFKDENENRDLVFEATVPEGHIFVMGDNRNGSSDSRSTHIGFINKDWVLGKAILRVDPFTTFD